MVIFVIIFVGIICQKRRMLNSEQIEGFEIFLFKIAMPCFLFTSTLQHDLAALLDTKYIIGYLLTFLIIAGIVSLCMYRANTASALCIKILASGYVNTAIYALPIITFLLKDPRAGILGNLVQVIFIQSIFIILLNFMRHKETSTVKKLISIFSTPMIVMPVVGLFCNYWNISLPSIITEAVQNVGAGASSIALFTFGLTLGGIKIRKEIFNKDLLPIIIIKNIIHPLVAFCIGNYLLHLDSYWLSALVIATSAPTGFIVYFIAKQFYIETVLVKRVVAISSMSSLVSLVVITLILWQ
jgi:malonate transporter